MMAENYIQMDTFAVHTINELNQPEVYGYDF